MKRLLLLFLTLILCQSAVLAQQPVRLIGGDNSVNPYAIANPNLGAPVSFAGLSAANLYANSGSIATTASTVTFTAPSTQFSIFTSPSAPTLYVNLTTTAAVGGAGNIPIFSGGTYNYAGAPISSVSIIGTSASGSWGIVAH